MYKLIYDEKFIRQIRKLNKSTAQRIYNWAGKNLNYCKNPRAKGKALKGNLSGLWRYRIGDYRLIAQIQDDKCVIIALEVGHRREVYR